MEQRLQPLLRTENGKVPRHGGGRPVVRAHHGPQPDGKNRPALRTTLHSRLLRPSRHRRLPRSAILSRHAIASRFPLLPVASWGGISANYGVPVRYGIRLHITNTPQNACWLFPNAIKSSDINNRLSAFIQYAPNLIQPILYRCQ